MLLGTNRQSFSRLFIAPGCLTAACALLLTASAQGKEPDGSAPRDDWDALPCRMQRIPNPEDDAEMGCAVDIEGDLAIAHSYNSGHNCVHVFRFDGAEWALEATLTAEESELGDAVALSGDVIVVGAQEDDEFGDHAGAAYIFHYDGAEWIEEAKLFASDPNPWDRFGYSVAVKGNLIAIGATEWNTPYWEGPGSAYVFELVGDQWIEQAKLAASDGQEDDRFGSEVAIEDETVIVLAWKAGALYFFQRVGEAWVERQKITPPGGPPNAGFWNVDLCGDLLGAGRPWNDQLGEYSGSALIYERVDDTWKLRQELLAHDGDEYHQFGKNIAIDGDAVLVGARGDKPLGGGPASAWAYLFRRLDGHWAEVDKFWGNAGLDGNFGQHLALEGDRAVISDYHEADGVLYAYAGMIGADCNSNGVADGCDIFLGTSEDMNENGIPDECECPGDFDGDGDVDTADLLYLLAAWGTPDGDVDFDGDTDTADLLALLAAWGECP